MNRPGPIYGTTDPASGKLRASCAAIRFEPSVTFAPARQVLASAGLGFYWRQSIFDALYGIPGQVVVPSNGVTDRYQGRSSVMTRSTPAP